MSTEQSIIQKLYLSGTLSDPISLLEIGGTSRDDETEKVAWQVFSHFLLFAKQSFKYRWVVFVVAELYELECNKNRRFSLLFPTVK
jgi:hypothetical protein